MSVVIPTFNSSRTIERTLESVENQTWKNLEIIVVDNRSDDNTLELASHFRHVRTFSGGPERSSQVNLGVAQSRGDYVYRIDSDFVLDPPVIGDAVAACADGADAVLIHNSSDPSISFWAKVRKVERDTLRDDWEHVAARFVRKSVFLAVGGLDDRLYAEEDRDFHEKLVRAGYKIVRIESGETHIGEPISLADVVRTHVYYGESIREYITMRGMSAGIKLGPFRKAFLRHWRDLASDPSILLGFFLYQYVRHLSAIVGLLVTQPVILRGESNPHGVQPGRNDVSVVIVTRDRPMDLAACLRSLEPAARDIREVIIVDDASSPSPVAIDSTLPVRVMHNEARSFLSQSRNKGAKNAKGKFVMFIDDDNIVDEKCLGKLTKGLEGDTQNMVASPAICYTSQPNKVWFAGGWIAPISGIFVAAFRGVDYNSLPRLPYYTEAFHDAFMIRREAFERVGFFDEINFPMYLSEADLAARLKESNLRAIVVPDARVWHNIAPLEGTASLLRGVHITEPVRAYFVGRNRILYMRKHSNTISFILHVLVFEPVFISIHLFAMLSGHGRIPWTRLFGPYLRGVLDGLSGRVSAGSELLRRNLG